MDRTRFNIGTYRFGGAIPGFRTEQHVRELKEAGIDFIASMFPGPDSEAFYRTMDLFEKYGVGAIAEGGDDIGAGCPKKAFGQVRRGKRFDPKPYQEAAKHYRPHPALWGFDIGDEPHGMDFPNLGKAVELCRQLYPSAFIYLNLYPAGTEVATNAADRARSRLGALSYEDYIEDYCRYVPLDYLCFDLYPYSRRVPTGIGSYFNSLKIAADACVNHGKSFWLVGQCNTYGRKPLTENKLRYQAYVGLAFGAEVMTWACWTKGWWTNNVYSVTGERTPGYDMVKHVNVELHLLGDACLKYRRVTTHFAGYTGAFSVYLTGCEGVSEPSVSTGWFRDVAAEDGEPILVTEMVPRDSRASGAQALFVMASEDPYDMREKERVIRFHPMRDTVEALDGYGALKVSHETDGFMSIRLRSNRGALVWIK